MSYELRKSDYYKVRHLLKELSFTLSDDAVMKGIRPGKICVDDVKNPKTAFVWAKPSEFCLAGYPDNDQFNSSLQNLIVEEIAPELLSRNLNFSVVFCCSDVWDSKIQFIFKSLSSTKKYRWLHAFKKRKVSWKVVVPSGFRAERIDEVFLESKNLLNINKVIDYIIFNWDSIYNYIQKGFGFCLVCGDEIVSWCISGNNVGKKCKLTIGTDEKYSNKGFASLTVSVFLSHCIKNNLKPVWHCGTENLPSIAVARKMGFEKESIFPVYTLVPNRWAYTLWLLKNKPRALTHTLIQRAHLTKRERLNFNPFRGI